jgi:hypothetical protein
MQEITVVCFCCREEKTLRVDSEKYQAWKNGKGYVQNLFPELSASDREFLLSSTCGPCFDRMFPTEEE